jgi:hypothetical protein
LLEATTCWIAAEHALQHARRKISSASEVFYRWKIQESEYVIQAGFDESLIKSGVGYLQQIHIFVSVEVDATSSPSLLSELGRIFSPFSSILFTESSSYHLPVFKDDGNIWEFDELIYFTASKFADGGSSTMMPPTVICLSQNPQADGPTGFSQGGSSNGGGEKQGSDKGKERGRRDDKDEANRQGKDKKDSDAGGENPPGDGTIAGLPEISFHIVSKINPIQGQEAFQTLVQDGQPADFQTLTMKGALTIQVLHYPY